MPKFRKKPVVIEARQYLMDENDRDIVSWIIGAGGKARTVLAGIEIETLEGVHLANSGDWIIKGVKGEFYPCKPEIFEMTYEPAE